MKGVISGSFRKHLAAIGDARKSFENSGIEVLAPLTQEVAGENDEFVFLSTDDATKEGSVLEQEFMDNIRKADFLYVANVGGYVGQSAAAEMGVAITHGIPVVVAETIKNFSPDVPDATQELLRKCVHGELSPDEINAQKIVDLHLQNATSYSLSPTETTLLRQLAEKLLESLKGITMTA